jgi:hypothetical protein
MEEHLRDEEGYGRDARERRESLPTDFETPSFQSVGEVVCAVFRLYRDNFPSIVKIVSVLTIPLILVQHVFLNQFQLVSWEVTLQVFTLVGESLISGALIYAAVIYLRTGAFPGLADSYQWGLKRWGKVLLCSFLLKVVIALGFMALIIPGIIFSLMFALVIPVAVVENASTLESFHRSRLLTKNYWMQIFLTYFLFTLIIMCVYLLTTFSLGGARSAESSLPFALVQGLIAQLLESSSTVLTLFIYLGILKDSRQFPPLTPQWQGGASVPPF